MKGESLETWATPEVWSDAAGFKKAGGVKYPALQALKASTDEAGFKAAYVDFGGTCKGCHDTFRRPKE
jgi:cytochrome c556